MKKSVGLFLLSVSLFLAAASPLHAGNETRNGGDVWVCPDSILLLDYSEAVESSVPLDLGPENLDFRQKIEFVLKRLERLDPVRTKLYQTYVDEFFSRTGKVVRWFYFPDVQDSNHHQKLKDCQLKQAAYQVHPETPLKTRYFVLKKYWDKMDATHRAGLILHEIIYREAIHFGHTDSVFVRQFNSLISSRLVEDMPQEVYEDELARLKFPSYGRPSSH